MGVYGIAVLSFFSCGISVILILTCGIAVSSSSAVCGFSSFWLTVFGEIGLFMVLRYRLFALSFQYNTQQNKTIKVNWRVLTFFSFNFPLCVYIFFVLRPPISFLIFRPLMVDDIQSDRCCIQ